MFPMEALDSSLSERHRARSHTRYKLRCLVEDNYEESKFYRFPVDDKEFGYKRDGYYAGDGESDMFHRHGHYVRRMGQ